MFGQPRNNYAEILTAAKVPNSETLEKLRAHVSAPLQNAFKVGDLVTQTIYGIDDDMEPMRRYKFPLPGQPAIVSELVQNPSIDDEGPSGVKDIQISTVCFDGKVRDFVVCSKFFRIWNETDVVDSSVVEWVEAQVRAGK